MLRRIDVYDKTEVLPQITVCRRECLRRGSKDSMDQPYGDEEAHSFNGERRGRGGVFSPESFPVFWSPMLAQSRPKS